MRVYAILSFTCFAISLLLHLLLFFGVDIVQRPIFWLTLFPGMFILWFVMFSSSQKQSEQGIEGLVTRVPVWWRIVFVSLGIYTAIHAYFHLFRTGELGTRVLTTFYMMAYLTTGLYFTYCVQVQDETTLEISSDDED